jgi:HK97 family phage portal protein
MVFRRTVTAHALIFGNGYAEIARDIAGRPSSLWQLHPTRVRPFYDGEDGRVIAQPSPRLALQYRVDEAVTLRPADILHVQGLSDDGVEGFNLVRVAREVLGLALSSQRFVSAFFANGTRFGGVLSATDRDLDEEQKKEIADQVEKLHGSAEKAFKLLVLGMGFKYEPAGVKPNEAQVKEIRDQAVAEVARYLNMPLHKLKLNTPGAVSYASVEMADLDYYKGCLLNWITLWEEELNAKLVPPLETGLQYFKHNARAFLRTDFKTQNDALGVARDKGIINADEWREYLDLNPQEGGQGKLYLVQQAQVPLASLQALVDSQIQKNQTPSSSPTRPGGDEDDGDDRVRRAETLSEQAVAAAAEARAQLAAAEATGQAHAQELDRLRGDADRSSALAVQLEEITTFVRDRMRQVEAERDAAAERLLAAERFAEHASTERDSARQEAVSAQAELDRLMSVLDQTEARVAAAQEGLAGALGQVEATEQALRSVQAETQADREAHTTSLTDAESARQAAELQLEAAQGLLAEAQRDRTDASAALSDTRETLETLEARVQQLDQEVREAHDRRTAVELELESARSTVATAEMRVSTLSGQLDDLRVTATEHQASLETHVGSLEEQVATADIRVRDLDAELSALRARTVEQEAAASQTAAALEAAQAESRRLAAALQAQTGRERTWRLATLAAHRGLIVDALGRMARREAQQARSRQATPEKLRRWMRTLSDNETTICVEALTPAIRTHLAWRRSAEDPATVTSALVQEHLSVFLDRLQQVLDQDDVDFHAALDRMLTRWETERPEEVADRLLLKEINDVA